MCKEVLVITDGTFSLSETDQTNIMSFYRNDGEMLGDVGNIPVLFYKMYLDERKKIETDFSYDGCIIEILHSNHGKTLRLNIFSVEEMQNVLSRKVKSMNQKGG